MTSDMSPLSVRNTHSVLCLIGHSVLVGLKMVESSVITVRMISCPRQKLDFILWMVM